MNIRLIRWSLIALMFAASARESIAQSPATTVKSAVVTATPTASPATAEPSPRSPASGNVGQRLLPPPTPATPLGQYQADVRAAVGKAWFARIDHDIAKVGHTGHLEIHCWISPEGKVTDIHVVSDSGGKQDLADATAAALFDAVITPIPPALAATLPKRGIEMAFNFSLY